ncbi:hypothetical protein D7D25_13920 [Proteiniphilum sp. X52]|nr:hypothetical protein D7D25_13920 [Proteiniphilum sp. X52]
MVTLKLIIVPAKVVKDAKHKIRIAVSHKSTKEKPSPQKKIAYPRRQRLIPAKWWAGFGH